MSFALIRSPSDPVSPVRPGEAQKSLEKPRNAQRGPERPSETKRETQRTQRGPATPRHPEKPREAQRGPPRPLVESGQISLDLTIQVIKF